jgi:hypothetical protein
VTPSGTTSLLRGPAAIVAAGELSASWLAGTAAGPGAATGTAAGPGAATGTAAGPGTATGAGAGLASIGLNTV